MSKLIAGLLFSLVAACAPSPNAPLPASSGSGHVDPCVAACANLAALGCSEGTAVDASGSRVCEATCRKGGQLTDLRPTCLASATSKSGARACGTVVCK